MPAPTAPHLHRYNTRSSARKRGHAELDDEIPTSSPTTHIQAQAKRRKRNLPNASQSFPIPQPVFKARHQLATSTSAPTSQVHRSKKPLPRSRKQASSSRQDSQSNLETQSTSNPEKIKDVDSVPKEEPIEHPSPDDSFDIQKLIPEPILAPSTSKIMTSESLPDRSNQSTSQIVSDSLINSIGLSDINTTPIAQKGSADHLRSQRKKHILGSYSDLWDALL